MIASELPADPFALDDHELLARALGPEAALDPRAQRQLLHRLHADLSCGDVALDGATAARLNAALCLGARLHARKRAPKQCRLEHAEAVFAWAEQRLLTLPHEELWVLPLDARSQLQRARLVLRGGLLGMQVAVRDVLREVLHEGACGYVLVHNHPSGDPTPSVHDLRFTRTLARASHTVGVPLLDHVVVGRNGYACCPLPPRGR